MPAPLALPTPVEIVASTEIEPMITAMHAEIERLRSDVLLVRHEAADLEARLVHEQIDPKASVWMALRLRAFLLGLRTEVENDCESHVAWARAEAERVGRGARPSLDFSFAGALGTSSAVWFDIDLPALEAATQPSIRWTSAPVVADPRPTAEPRAAVTPSEVRAPEPTTTVAPTDVTTLAGESPVDVEVASASESSEQPFWPADAPRWSRLRRRPSRATALQALAGVVVMLAAVVHFA
jgi:hypothetical protein